MSLLTIFLLALSLSADAFAVAIATGISQQPVRTKQALSMAFSFGFFQAIMPIMGFLLASLFAKQIMSYDHWIAFILLAYIGGNMIYAGWQWADKGIITKDVFLFRSLVTLGIATSIDALAVGVSLTGNTTDIYLPALIIGVMTFIISYIGLEFGKRWGFYIGSRSEMIWGLILIGIGTHIFIEHLIAA